jgi:hypothetical protein
MARKGLNGLKLAGIGFKLEISIGRNFKKKPLP